MSNKEKADLGGVVRNKKLFKTLGIIATIFIISFGLFLNYFTKNYLYNGRINENVHIEGIDVSDMSKSQALDVIYSKYVPEKISLEFEEKKFEIEPEDIDLVYNTKELVEDAYSNTKTGSYVKDLMTYFNIKFKGKEYFIKPSFDEKKLELAINQMSENINRQVADAKVSVGAGVNITPSITGRKFNVKENKEMIVKSIEEKKYNIIELNVTKVKPKISTKDVQAINSQLVSFTTSFNAGQTKRSHNIGLAASRCNNVILLPGETFSYNEHTGMRTLSNGYLNAPVIIGNELQDGPGGGVCQTSTTLFNAVLLSGLELTQVTNHSQTSTYAPRGRDAMVNDGGSDLKFKNNFDHAVYVQCYRSGGTVTAAIYGAKSDKVGVNIRVDNFTYNGLPASKTYRTITKNGKSETSYIYTGVYKK